MIVSTTDDDAALMDGEKMKRFAPVLLLLDLTHSESREVRDCFCSSDWFEKDAKLHNIFLRP